jgi:hypothetical protein
MISRSYMLKRVSSFYFSYRISDLSICSAQQEQVYGINSQKRAQL